ncbi:succinylglutamate desuccinylase/aspartoacylase family protein [Thalassomonas sp. M1454]|uniref:succinylglutamate desuccinylase/aspartoacylase domain-containing protein n=1 Tax=Thalassomonas sp. M1454 TaxID=2594477 RepID=UPI00117FEAE0|nr:succinylglutamate desuccinylase/aspartoacylase family protein [Thalassomonas sp. M1454]TRX56387.1 hypothetical protein FNN08_02325 [Thalassomonas sp. M1454]
MAIDFAEINYLSEPDLFTLKSDHLQFLLSICGPTVIDVAGIDPTRCRVITTLIHGNEPSGLIALHRWLTNLSSTNRPVTNMRFIICSPDVASVPPTLSHRYLEDGLDLNRCFGHNLDYGYFKRANLICKAINEVKPEVLIDLHNTSGCGPAFAVSVNKTELALSLSSLFCSSVILSEIKLGAIMEQDFDCQTLTVECGGSKDQQSHEVAYQGICHLASIDNIQACHYHRDVDVFLTPLRLQVKPGVELNYADIDEGFSGLTLITNIEQFNYGVLRAEQMLGWLDQLGLDNLQIIDKQGNNCINQYFTLRGNQLISKIDLNIFMATKVINIAKSDCLLYLVPNKNKM